MLVTISQVLYILYLLIISYNIAVLNCEIFNDNSPDAWIDIKNANLFMQIMEPRIFASGDTSETTTDITMTSMEITIIMTSEVATVSSTMEYSLSTFTTSNDISTISGTSASADYVTSTIQSTTIDGTPTTFNPDNSTYSTSTQTVTTTTTTTADFNHLFPETCLNITLVPWINGTCIEKSQAREGAVNILRDNNATSSGKAEALLVYFGAAANLTLNTNETKDLTPTEVDRIVNASNNVPLLNSSIGLFFALSRKLENDTILGGSITVERNNAVIMGINNTVIKESTKSLIIESNITTGVILDDESLDDNISIKVFIPGENVHYQNLDTSNNKSVISQVIVFNVERQTINYSIKVSLYLQDLQTQELRENGKYLCSFFNTTTSKWENTGCSKPIYNTTLSRHECTCDHLTTFALIWLPNGPLSKDLSSQDIASLIFQSISIICFIIVITHSTIVRLHNPLLTMKAHDLLPLISSASTTILFIFFIALGMTVYTQTPSENETKCFLNSSILMFFVYFFLIFMFCTKTSIGYFNYLRFVRLFPEPPRRQLFVFIIVSFFISIICTSFAIGFNSNPSYNITQLYPYKLCWFTRDVFYYFVIIPIGIFLLLNFITIILVIRRIVHHVRYATTRHQSYERMKQFILVLLSSCITQGVGWLIGPIITFVQSEVGNVLSWVFIICNGLEGLWTILLYIIIWLRHLDQPKRVTDSKEFIKQSSSRKKESKGKFKISRISRRKSKDNRRNDSDREIDSIDLEDINRFSNATEV
ncbi:unnamed protein product [Rotaria socialis]|uniref:G-protein coupled receptors family 2 profile 2 domain-containing protein n=2 Tax=Rotaria socialis TaxID=392032 RepID=A0A817XT89_9BILA|nr:unnamed protein product [Rotaria socialis]CAF3597604.1 unnamed protein product [Rotaria socialis]CAF4138612.1 unnamed protein product [Rotaria socialis]CAF4294140.1 unnamed protein product [Rotaria socialis]CAF4436914.1 unnamed protein product [Rotaria socialis]